MCPGRHYGGNVYAPRRPRLPAYTRFSGPRIGVAGPGSVSSRAIFRPARGRGAMGFLDKAKEAAQQASVKAKEAAEQAQKKLEEKQAEFNERQAERAREQGGAQGPAAASPPPPPPPSAAPPPTEEPA